MHEIRSINLLRMKTASSDPSHGSSRSTRDASLSAESDSRRYKRLAALLLLMSITLFAFFVGMYVQQSRVFPYNIVSSAYKTLVVALETNGVIRSADDEYYGASIRNNATGDAISDSGVFRPYGCVDIEDSVLESIREGFSRVVCEDVYASKDDAPASRIELVEGVGFAAPILVQGERGTFTDLCPGEHGCLAVQYSRSGDVLHAYPYRLGEIHAANIVSESEFPYEHGIGWSFEEGAEVSSVSRYSNGDLLVVLEFKGSFPYGGGVARISPNGSPVWYRKDYSHHWAYLMDDEVAVVPSTRMDREQRDFTFDGGNPFAKLSETWRCHGYLEKEQLSFIDGEGNLLEQVSVFDAITESLYAEYLRRSKSRCGPTHLNFVHVLGEDFPSVGGIMPGDIVVSLRNMHAFGVLDGETHRLKRMVRGSFLSQHSVQHLDGARLIMFDNSGTDGAHGPSRLLIVDLADGRETTVFPNDDTPRHLLNFFAPFYGRVDVSPDRRRALLTDVDNGRGLEIRLSDGAVMNIFHNLHDVSGLDEFPGEHAANAWRFTMRDISYIKR